MTYGKFHDRFLDVMRLVVLLVVVSILVAGAVWVWRGVLR